MAIYKGVEIDNAVSPFVPYMPLVEEYREMLQSLQAVWDNLNLLGQLSGTTAEMSGTREAFSQLTGELLSSLAERTLAKRSQEKAAKAQVVIDILVRNLFERTADIGFLATDGEIRRFAEHGGELDALRARFHDYVRKYSVYDDVVLLDNAGRVLVRLAGDEDLAVAGERWFGEAQDGARAYAEYYGPSALFPARPASLIYAYRVCSASGRQIGVLALSFRFADEMGRIFAKLAGGEDALVLALLDAGQCVIASSDPWQLPLGAALALAPGEMRRLRFAGRNYLALACRSHGYQGYAGPGWLGVSLLPLDQAFAASQGDAVTLDDTLLAAVLRSARAFPEALRAIPGKAEAIQRNLGRSVWNGTVRSSARDSAVNPGFSKILLREISRTGMRMREVFSTSINKLQTTVLSSQLDDCAFIADLAIDIMDRNLYERANDCRWWALDPQLAQLTADAVGGAGDAAAMGDVLACINGLYTVYARLVVFDAEGRILAVSRADEADRWQGESIDGDWVQSCLTLPGQQAYAVSPFTATPLYDGRPTYIYAAAIRAPAHGRVVGGIAIVFDAAPQFRAMLQDVLPRDNRGQPLPGSVTLFLDDARRIIAASDDAWAVGESCPVPLDTLVIEGGRGRGLIESDGQIYAVGLARSAGYREYKGPDDPYRNDITAVTLVPLGESLVEVGATVLPPVAGQIRRPGGEASLEVATFFLGSHWLGLPVVDVVEAIELSDVARLANAPGQVYGALLYKEHTLPLYNLHAALGVAASCQVHAMQVVVVRAEDGRLFGVLVDALGEVNEVALADIADVSSIYVGVTPVLASVVRSEAPGQSMLTLLSTASMASSLNA